MPHISCWDPRGVGGGLELPPMQCSQAPTPPPAWLIPAERRQALEQEEDLRPGLPAGGRACTPAPPHAPQLPPTSLVLWLPYRSPAMDPVLPHCNPSAEAATRNALPSSRERAAPAALTLGTRPGHQPGLVLLVSRCVASGLGSGHGPSRVGSPSQTPSHRRQVTFPPTGLLIHI